MGTNNVGLYSVRLLGNNSLDACRCLQHYQITDPSFPQTTPPQQLAVVRKRTLRQREHSCNTTLIRMQVCMLCVNFMHVSVLCV